jgi:hypothetical protein
VNDTAVLIESLAGLLRATTPKQADPPGPGFTLGKVHTRVIAAAAGPRTQVRARS